MRSRNHAPVHIRPELPADVPAVARVNTRAFGQDNEARLVDTIRRGPHFIPELSLVAESDGVVTGYILFSSIHIRGDDGVLRPALALAPMAVAPEYQRCGIGSLLVAEGLKCARELGYGAVIVLGHPEYYPKFGFRPASQWNIRSPYDVPDEVFMAIELREHALSGQAGMVVYPEEFMDV
jgi:putative acetyltransferase